MTYDGLAIWISSIFSLLAIGYSAYNRFYYNQKLAEQKGEIERLNSEHQIRFSKLHEEKANHIKKLYSEIQSFHSTFWMLRIDLKGEGMIERMQAKNQEVQKIIDYHNTNAILLSADLENDILELLNQYHKGIMNYVFYLSEKTTDENPVKAQKFLSTFNQIEDEKIPEILEKIKLEFRSILGA